MKKSFLQPVWRHSTGFHERLMEIKPYITAKSVLDVGCGVGYRKQDWLHGLIKEQASSILGLDINGEVVTAIQERGFNVIYADAQNFNLNQVFDVIHAGELIEHLDNFHGFLRSCKTHLTENGLLIITTPNAMRASNFIYSLLGGLQVNKEHTCWFCDKTITTLLERNGFKVINISYLKHETPGIMRRLVASAIRIFLPANVARNTLMIVSSVK